MHRCMFQGLVFHHMISVCKFNLVFRFCLIHWHLNDWHTFSQKVQLKMLTSLHHESLQSGVCLVMHGDNKGSVSALYWGCSPHIFSEHFIQTLKSGVIHTVMWVEQLLCFLDNTQKMGQDREIANMRELVL